MSFSDWCSCNGSRWCTGRDSCDASSSLVGWGSSDASSLAAECWSSNGLTSCICWGSYTELMVWCSRASRVASIPCVTWESSVAENSVNGVCWDSSKECRPCACCGSCNTSEFLINSEFRDSSSLSAICCSCNRSHNSYLLWFLQHHHVLWWQLSVAHAITHTTLFAVVPAPPCLVMTGVHAMAPDGALAEIPVMHLVPW